MPPAAIAAALASALIHASWNAALKRGRDRLVDSFLVGIGGLVLALVLIAALGAPRADAWPYVIASSLLHTLYWFTLMRGYDAGDMSHVYTLARGSAPLLVAVGAALAAHEIPGPTDMIGIALVSAGVLCVGVSPRAPLKVTLWALAMGACISTYSLVDALGARVSQNAALYISWNTALMSTLMIAFALLRRGPAPLLSAARLDPWRGLLVGAVSMGGYGLVLWAQTIAPIAQVTALRESSVVFGALIAWAFLRERLGLRRWLGAALAASGAALLALA